MKANRKEVNQRLFRIVSAILISLLVISCNEEPEFLGSGLIPDGDMVNVEKVDTFIIKSKTILADNYGSLNKSGIILGSIADDIFGKTTANLASEIRLSEVNPSFLDSTDLQIDSLQLLLSYYKSEGDSTVPVKYNFYKLNQSFFENLDSINNDYDFTNDIDNFNGSVEPFYSTELSFENFMLDSVLTDSTVVDSVYNDVTEAYDSVYSYEYTYSNFLKFNLPLDMANKLYTGNTETDSITFSATSELRNIFGGLLVEVENLTSDAGALFFVNLWSSASNLNLHYSYKNYEGERESGTFPFYIDTQCDNFNPYLNDNSETVNKAIENNDDTIIYVKTLQGVRGKLDLTGLNSLKEQDLAINKAYLNIKAFNEGNDYELIGRFLPKYYTDEGDLDFIEDAYLNVVDAVADSSLFEYNINITHHLLRFLNEELSDPSIILFPENDATRYEKVRLLNSETNPIKLEIIFTEL